MWISLGLSVALLVNLPFFGHVDVKRMLRSRHAHPTAADSLPPLWRNASRLALENHFVFAELPDLTPQDAALKISADPRDLRIDVDADSGLVTTAPEFGDVELGAGASWPLGSYGSMMMARNFRHDWKERSVQNVNSLGTNTPAAAPTQAGIHIPIGRLPTQLSGILGPGGPAINVRGSENIRISGTSNWTNQEIGPVGQKRSLFPSLDMQQDLDIQLEGQLSDRIRVNLLQNSANQIPLANRIAINYHGDEDALFQQIDLGNTNLTLPGTQYVSYSGKNEGLFGMKATSRFGPLDFTMLASKQEGRSERASYGGGASKQNSTLRDIEYIRGVYYFFTDPNDGSFDLSEATLKVYLDDGNSINDIGETRDGIALPDPTDPAQVSAATNPADSTALYAGRNPGQLAVRGIYNLLTQGADKDYEILGDIYGTGFKILRLTQPLLARERLAVTYDRHPIAADGSLGALEAVGGGTVTDADGVTRTVMKLLRVPPDLIGPLTATPDAVFDNTKALNQVREVELRNFYNLGGQRIDPATFKLSIRQGTAVPPKTTAATPGGLVPYIEILGLDNLDETTNPPQRGKHDGVVDGTVLNSTLRAFVDFENGTLFFPDPHPFAPRLGPGTEANRFDHAVDTVLFRRARLTGQDPNTQADILPNDNIYSHYQIQGDIDSKYFMDVEFTAARASGEVSLGRGNLLEGSEVVTINGQTLQRDHDYRIDYDLGRLTLIRQLGPSDNLNVDYSYAPLFQQAGRTLIGSAFNLQGKDRSLGGAFMYESRGAQDLRPRLGEEPARSLIGDLNTSWAFRPQWMTRMVDLLPGVRTTAPSDFNFQAEVGASLPNPNTRNQVYIDDMEGVRDAVSLTMDQSHWRWSSVPKRSDPPHPPDGHARLVETMLDAEARGLYKDAETHWYSPYAVVKERDLKPTLTQSDPQAAQNNRQALAWSVPRRPTLRSTPNDTLWTGLTYSLDPVGLDLRQSQFIELWVNDFNDWHSGTAQVPRIRGRHVKLHIDLGKVSEDAMRAPNRRPNRLLDTEDKDKDGQLTVVESEQRKSEDTGVDGLLDPDEVAEVAADSLEKADLSTATDQDPEGDDYRKVDTDSDPKTEIDAARFLRINGTEGDKDLNPYPETEDYNQNLNLDTDENFFEYTIDLGDDADRYLVTDLQHLKAIGEPGYGGVEIDNGWRRYRIPIDDSLRVQFGVPDLSISQHVRMWLEGLMSTDTTAVVAGKTVERPLVMLGGLDVVGSRWRSVDLDTLETQAGATLTLNSVNSIDNADVYVAPFDPGSQRNGNQAAARREQSISLEFTKLRPQTHIEAFKTFSLDEDYSRYGKLDWFVTGFDVHDDVGASTNTGLYYFVRFGSDDQGQNYYEYHAPLPVSTASRGIAWQEVQLALTELSSLKLDPSYPISGNVLLARPRTPGSADSLIVKGRPSFTRLRRISFGLVNQLPDREYQSGQIWFDELRAIDVAKDRGHAERLSAGGRLANLLQYNMTWNSRDENFTSVGESRGSGTATSNFGFSSGLDLHRFFEATGIILPVSFNFSQGKQRPRYSAGDDIVRSGEDLIRSESFSDNRSWSVSYSRTWSTRANPFLLYTLGGVTANYNTSNTHSLTPSGSDRSATSSGSVSYSVAPRNLLVVPVMFTKAKLFPLPERFYSNYRFDQRDGSTADRVPGTDTLITRDPISGQTGTINLGADSRPLDFLHHHIEAVRNLNVAPPGTGTMLKGRLYAGRNVAWNQTTDASWTPHFLPWVRPQVSWSSRYNQNNGPELSPDLSVRSIQNGQQSTVRWELPFASLASASSVPRSQPSPADTSHKAAKPAGPAIWRRLMSRIGTVSAEFGFNRGSSYSRLNGTPDFMYLFGLRSDPGLGIRTAPVNGNQSTTSTGWRTSGRTNVQLPWSMSVQTSGEFETHFATGNGAERGTDQLRFPDVTVDFGQFASALGLSKIVKNPQLRSAANRQVSNDYANGRGAKTGITTLLQFRPLLSVSGDLPNGMRMELGTEHRHSDRELLQLGSSLQQDINTDVNLNLTRSYTQGQKISFLGKESTVRSSITIGINSQYERQTGRIVQNGVERNPVRRDRLSVNATGSYGFSASVSGNATLGFSQDRDQLRAIVHRSVRVELSARFGL